MDKKQDKNTSTNHRKSPGKRKKQHSRDKQELPQRQEPELRQLHEQLQTLNLENKTQCQGREDHRQSPTAAVSYQEQQQPDSQEGRNAAQPEPRQQPTGPWGNQPQGQQHRGPGQQQGGPGQQQSGPWGNQPQGQQHKGPGQQQGGPRQQQSGPWRNQPQGQQQKGPGQQHGRPGQQQSGPWGNQPQGQQEQGPGQQPGGPGQQQTGPGGNQPQGQQQKGPGQQQGGPRQQQSGPWGNQPQVQQQPGGPGKQQTGPGGNQPQGQQQRGPCKQQTGAEGGGRPQVKSQPKKGGKEPETTRLRTTTADILMGVTKESEALAVCKSNKGAGNRQGRNILVETNFLRLNCKNWKLSAFHYDVVTEPDRPVFMLRHVFKAFAQKHFPKRFPSFDGKKNAISNGPLPNIGEGSLTDELEVLNPERNTTSTYKITMQHVNTIDLSVLESFCSGKTTSRSIPQNALLAVDIILRNNSALNMIQNGRQFFTAPKGQVIPLGEGLEMWYGFYQSAILGARPYVNIDVAHKGFPRPCKVVDAIKDLCNKWEPGQSIGQRDLPVVQKFLRHLKVSYEVPKVANSKRVFRINDLKGSASTVQQYFRTEKQYELKYPELPCLWVGSVERNILIPAELCTILPGQVVNRKYTEKQTAAMVKNSVCNTKDRKRRILDAMQQANMNGSPYARDEFGLSVGGEFEKVQARVLPPPTLEYSGSREVAVSKGVWRPPGYFMNAKSPGKWCILNLDSRTRNDALQNFEKMLEQHGRTLGMTFPKAAQPVTNLDMRRPKEFENFFQNCKSMDLVFVVVPDFPKDVYSKVKTCAEIQVGVLTQCVRSRTMFKMNPATVGNILLKVNAKLDGINHSLSGKSRPSCLNRPCMIIGADVTHPSPDSRDIPSVAAVAASHDPKAFKYNMVWRLQDPKQEMIQDFEEIILEQLKYFHKMTQFKPEKILYFRDGVSEAQMGQVLDVELKAIHRACRKIQADGSYQPKVTVVIVQKRHHTRFFPTNDRDCEDRNFNVPAGTCVDREIVHPRDIDFYLQSHASILGTGRPTKYRLIWDDNDMSEAELEELAYYLCHLFSRCNRSVSYPAPTYYAHLAAFRARVYLEGHRINLDNLRHEENQRRIKETILQTSPMFFV